MIKSLFITAIFTLIFLTASGSVSAQTSTEPNFKVAFIGDSSAGNNFQSVLNLIKAEGAQMVLHQGDFDYSAGPQLWMDKINNTLGANFPYLGSDGNHDIWDTDGYAAFFKDRLTKMGLSAPSGNLPTNYSAVYKGLKMVFVQENGNPSYIAQELGSDNHVWKICSWHKNVTNLQLGTKGNEQGYPDYETCRQYGAIIATAHEHTYERTKTFANVANSIQNLTIDTTQHPVSNGIPGNPNSVLVAPGKSFVFVSGLGGNGPRNQDRCLPTTYPYGGGAGCNYIWGSVWTTDQGGSSPFGALFITFNAGGVSNKATGYFKTISGQTVDQFEITASSTGSPPPNTSPTPTPPTGGTPPANLNCRTNPARFTCFEAWRSAFTSGTFSNDADMNNSGTVTIADFEIWRRAYTAGATVPTTPAGQSTPTPTLPAPQVGDLDISICDPSKGYFTTTLNNPYLPLQVGMVHVLEKTGFKVQVSVLNQTEVVAGVTTRVIEEKEWKNGSLIEISRNFFVQTPDKTICYFGEDVDIYNSSGQITGHSGAWRAGVGANKPGIQMPGQPAIGQSYQQEIAPGVAMDRAEHVSMNGTLTTPAGTFNNVLVVNETPPSDKQYAPGVGMIYDDGMVLTKK